MKISVASAIIIDLRAESALQETALRSIRFVIDLDLHLPARSIEIDHGAGAVCRDGSTDRRIT